MTTSSNIKKLSKFFEQNESKMLERASEAALLTQAHILDTIYKDIYAEEDWMEIRETMEEFETYFTSRLEEYLKKSIKSVIQNVKEADNVINLFEDF